MLVFRTNSRVASLGGRQRLDEFLHRWLLRVLQLEEIRYLKVGTALELSSIFVPVTGATFSIGSPASNRRIVPP
jgi:hypothetical protein